MSEEQAVDAEPELYEVEDLLEVKELEAEGEKHCFWLVKWRGFEEATWEPDANLGSDLQDKKAELLRKMNMSDVPDALPGSSASEGETRKEECISIGVKEYLKVLLKTYKILIAHYYVIPPT